MHSICVYALTVIYVPQYHLVCVALGGVPVFQKMVGSVTRTAMKMQDLDEEEERR